jgi:(3S)-malyl-CoA thioesterase
MDATLRPWRSMLYIPGSNARALDKARDLPCDAIIFDLEDAVAMAEKATARDLLCQALRQGGYGDRALLVRINPLSSEWGQADLEAVAAVAPQSILLPKVAGPDDIAQAARLLDDAGATGETNIWAMIETPQGVLNAPAIARAQRMQGFVIGTNDLAQELGCRHRPDRLPLLQALQSCLLAARAAGIMCIDGVYNAFRDLDGLALECAQGRDLGMDGKTLIHPGQIEMANRVFSPDADEIETARQQIAAFEAAEAEGRGVAVLDGRIVENLHVAGARRTLARARATGVNS